MSTPSIQRQLHQVITEALALPYISESPYEGIKTGNHYQSVLLDGERTSGFRTGRTDLLDMVRFEGKRVLDLGSNLGELSREVRLRGAELVDGYEVDPFFVEIARATNAARGITRVSFYERDITDPATFVEPYDVVLGMSVFIYMRPVLEHIAAVTRELLVVETHRLTGNLESTYLTPLTQHFPFYALLGESEWGTNHSDDEKRALLAFAREPSTLVHGLAAPVEVRTFRGQAPDGCEVTIDSGRTAWFDRFFEMFPSGSVRDRLAGIDGLDVSLAALEWCSDLRSHVMSGWAYWYLYVKGALQYRRSGVVDDDNVYLRYMLDSYSKGNHDRALVRQLSEGDAAGRIERRFQDFNAIMDGRPVDLVVLTLREQAGIEAKVLYEHGTGRALVASEVDGYHRLFASRFAGRSEVAARVRVR